MVFLSKYSLNYFVLLSNQKLIIRSRAFTRLQYQNESLGNSLKVMNYFETEACEAKTEQPYL